MKLQRTISVTGLGYVGLTVASAFGEIGEVVGFDKSDVRIKELQEGYDRNGEVSAAQLHHATIEYTTNADKLKKANFHIISVPTPINGNKQPDFSYLHAASATVGHALKKGDIVVYESSVYPGATEEICIPILEKASGLICGIDFGVGYSPERINPSDKEHVFSKVPKIISAVNKESLDIIADVYARVVKAGVYRVSSIRVAEATKIIENIQRDVNVSLVNEIAMILHNLGIDSREVLTAAKTKWNFLPFTPGLVGGHCVGINNCYLTYKAEETGFHPDLLVTSRRINEYMPTYIVENTIKQLIHLGVSIPGARIAILGLTYKENYPDVEDSKANDIIHALQRYNTQIFLHDPIAPSAAVKKVFQKELYQLADLNNMDAIILAVSHQEYYKLHLYDFEKILKPNRIIMDVKSILRPDDFKNSTITLWQL